MHSLAARALSVLAPPFCWHCGADARPDEPLCGPCRRTLRWLGAETVTLPGGLELFAPVAYEGPARALVRALKYRGATALAGAMAAQMVACAPAELLRAGTVLVPVPLHPARARRRGYNQAERIARALGRRTGLAVEDCLRRAGPGDPQVGRGRQERLASLDGRVSLRRGAEAPDAAVLVDDVATTGGTLGACAGALRGAGSHKLAGITYARTLNR